MRRFWPASEAAQLDYETLRSAALDGTPLLGASAAHFDKSGLAGLIVSPSADPRFAATLIGARRPPWTPYHDPRQEALAACYGYLLGRCGVEILLLREVR